MAGTELISQCFRFADMANCIAAVQNGSLWPAGTGRKLGAWQVITGPLNRVLLLRERAERCAGGLDDEPQGNPPVVRSEVDVLRSLHPFSLPQKKAQLFELRIYTVFPGLTAEFARLMIDALPVRERFSRNVGVWRAQSGNTDRIFHLWAYTDLAHRDAVRQRVNVDAEWSEYVSRITPLLAEMENMMLTPLLITDSLPKDGHSVRGA